MPTFSAATEVNGSRGHHHRTIHDLLKQVTTVNPHCLNLGTCVPDIVTTGKKAMHDLVALRVDVHGPVLPNWVDISM